MNEFIVITAGRYQLIDIGFEVKRIVLDNKVKNGLVLVTVPHTTASILITENEPRLLQDWLAFFERIVSEFDFQHNRNEFENNGDSHIIAGLLSPEKLFPVQNEMIFLGQYQQIFLVELDGPRKRKVIVQVCHSTL